jgi:hypothetical protein
MIDDLPPVNFQLRFPGSSVLRCRGRPTVSQQFEQGRIATYGPSLSTSHTRSYLSGTQLLPLKYGEAMRWNGEETVDQNMPIRRKKAARRIFKASLTNGAARR